MGWAFFIYFFFIVIFFPLHNSIYFNNPLNVSLLQYILNDIVLICPYYYYKIIIFKIMNNLMHIITILIISVLNINCKKFPHWTVYHFWTLFSFNLFIYLYPWFICSWNYTITFELKINIKCKRELNDKNKLIKKTITDIIFWVYVLISV